MRRHVLAGALLVAALMALDTWAQNPAPNALVHLVPTLNHGSVPLIRLRANVVTMDLAGGTMGLARPTGGELVLHVGSIAGELAPVQAGDTIVVRYIPPLALRFRPARDASSGDLPLPESMVAAPGLTPRPVMVGVRHLQAFLRTVDLQARTAVIEIDDGVTVDLQLPASVEGLERVRFGERVAISFSEPVVVELASHEPAATLQHAGAQDGPGATEPAWGYSGATGPEHWGDLSPQYALCKTGEQQSPIDLSSRESRWPSPALRFDYRPAPLDLLNDGHTVVFRMPEGGSFTVDKRRYALSEMRIHTPSEHTIDGRALEMEFQLVHRDAEGQVAVLAILVERGRQNAVLAPVWPRLPETAGSAVRDLAVSLNPAGLLPRNHSHYAYTGSSSTPPCREGVEWLVMSTPIQCSRAQIAAFRAIYRENARPVQSRQGRKVGLRWVR